MLLHQQDHTVSLRQKKQGCQSKKRTIIWNILITGPCMTGHDMEKSEIFKTMKRQWHILITGS